MSGTTIISPNTVDTTLIQDGQAAGSITPLDIRQMNDSVTGLAVSNTVTTSTYTFAATDRGSLVKYNVATTAGTFTAPANIFQPGSVVGYRPINTGLLTIVAGSGFTLNISSTLTATLGQWATGFIHFDTATSGTIM